jgi:hypothetical protein
MGRLARSVGGKHIHLHVIERRDVEGRTGPAARVEEDERLLGLDRLDRRQELAQRQGRLGAVVGLGVVAGEELVAVVVERQPPDPHEQPAGRRFHQLAQPRRDRGAGCLGFKQRDRLEPQPGQRPGERGGVGAGVRSRRQGGVLVGLDPDDQRGVTHAAILPRPAWDPRGEQAGQNSTVS